MPHLTCQHNSSTINKLIVVMEGQIFTAFGLSSHREKYRVVGRTAWADQFSLWHFRLHFLWHKVNAIRRLANTCRQMPHESAQVKKKEELEEGVKEERSLGWSYNYRLCVIFGATVRKLACWTKTITETCAALNPQTNMCPYLPSKRITVASDLIHQFIPSYPEIKA